jgi:hypothetical protein
MKSYTSVLAILGIIFGLTFTAFAEYHPEAQEFGDKVDVRGSLTVRGDVTGNAGTLGSISTTGSLAAGAALISGSVTAGSVRVTGDVNLGDTTGTDNVNLYSFLTLQTVAQTLTNAHYLAAVWPRVVLNTLVASNDISLAPATYAGQLLLVQCSPSLTNVIALADSGTAILSAQFNGGANDSLLLIANAASNWVEAARSNN